MTKKKATAWAVRFWRWVSEEAQNDETGDLGDQLDRVFRRFPSEAMARAMGPRMVEAEPLAADDGFDLMRGTPDRFSADGWDWKVAEEIRP